MATKHRKSKVLFQIFCLSFGGLFYVMLNGCSAARPAGAPGYSTYHDIAFSPDGRTLATAKHPRNEVTIYRVLTDMTPQLERVRTLKGKKSHFLTARSLAWSPDGTRLATAGLDGVVIIWDPHTGEEIQRFPDLVDIETLTFLPDGKSLIMAGPGSTVRVWNIASDSQVTELQGHTAPVLSVAVAPKRKMLATSGSDRTIRLWDTRNWSLIRTLEGHYGPVLSVEFSPDETLLLSTSNGVDIRLWKIGENFSGQETGLTDVVSENIRHKNIAQLSQFISLIGAVASIASTGSPGVYGAPAVMGGTRMPQPAFNCPATFSPDGKQIAYIHLSHELSSSYHLQVIDAQTYEPIQRFHGYIGALDYHPSSSFLVSGGAIMLMLIDPISGKEY